MKFWLERGVDGLRLDTVNYYFHSRSLKSNPPAKAQDVSVSPPDNPYNQQDHIYDKSQPENLIFLRELRALLDRYPARAALGEIGDGERSLATMAAYTSGGDKLHMCYTFDFLSPVFTPGHFRESIAAVEAILGDGWPCWAFSNHDVTRHITRWAHTTRLDPDRLARLSAALLLSLRGSVCLYQGEELGLEEAELRFEDLVDPYGIRFWPEYRGRDGCRTPMVWEADAPNAGFSSAKPWLPVAPAHIAHAADKEAGDPSSILSHYRRLIHVRRAHGALRKGSIAFMDAPDGILAFTREEAGERIACLFNLTATETTVSLPDGIGVVAIEGGPGGSVIGDGRTVLLAPGGAFWGLFV